jgi:hypothetical protein
MSDTFDKYQLDRACFPIFEKLRTELGDRYCNWVVAIEPQTEDYFLGQDSEEVLERARATHPTAKFFAYRFSEDTAVDRL